MTEWPDWWDWTLELSPHLLKRMLDRDFTEVDLRLMMENASSFHEDEEPGRYVVETRHKAQPWEVVLEPDAADRLLVVITAYPWDQP